MHIGPETRSFGGLLGPLHHQIEKTIHQFVGHTHMQYVAQGVLPDQFASGGHFEVGLTFSSRGSWRFV